MIDSTKYNQINEAIVKFVEANRSKAEEQQIIDEYGTEITLAVKAIYDAAMDCPVDWQKENMNEALGILADFMTVKFPWLSGEARTSLNYCYIMTWK